MNTKETIAFIGDIEKTCSLFLGNLVQMDLHLLFIYKNEQQAGDMEKQLELKNTVAEIEIIPCAKEGCWEADIIAFVQPEDVQAPLVERIKEVATQKIVLCISDGKAKKHAFSETQIKQLRQGLPYSKIVRILIDSEEMNATIYGENKEARDTVAKLMENAGYKINWEAEPFGG